MAELKVHSSLLYMLVMERNVFTLTPKHFSNCKDVLLTILRLHGKAIDGCTFNVLNWVFLEISNLKYKTNIYIYFSNLNLDF